jgi:sugar phosphate isomerase/epimerase
LSAETLDLSICLDTGHLLAGYSGPVDFFESVDLCLPRLAEVHLHDSPSYLKTGEIMYGQDHSSLGSGDLKTGEFLDRLNQAEFQGLIIFELQQAEARQSLRLIEDLRPEYI